VSQARECVATAMRPERSALSARYATLLSGPLVLLCLAAVVQCGGSSSGDVLSCGPGTVLESGQCVPESFPDSGHTASDAAPSDSGHTASDAAPSDYTGDGLAADSTDHVVNDSCPSIPVAINCSSDCGGTLACNSCAPNTTHQEHLTVPAAIRTPAITQADPQCSNLGCSVAPAYSIAITYELPADSGASGMQVHVTTSAPWYVDGPEQTNSLVFCPFRLGGPAPSGCVSRTLSAGSRVFAVVATDTVPAPATNVLIEEGPCPGSDQ
jgi:hypothetical protein